MNTLKVEGQDSIWLKQAKIEEVIKFEEAVSPHVTFLKQNVGLSGDSYPLLSKHQVRTPLIAKRQGQGSLPVYAEYFYTPGDSIIRLVS
ncbi:MAG TPA: hypothetical protein VHK69_14185, partial [Chitinophagaceae bacterium]|nr:hypothetical protein [Chitinophagaceae bacterium]